MKILLFFLLISAVHARIITYSHVSGGSGTAPAPGSGDVVGPGSSGNDNITTFDGTTGKKIKDSGIHISAITDLQASATDWDNHNQVPQSGLQDQVLTWVAGAPTWATMTGGGSGDVVGPASATQTNYAIYSDTTGNLIGVSKYNDAAIDTEVSRIGQNELDIIALQASATEFQDHNQVPDGGQENQILTTVAGVPTWATPAVGNLGDVVGPATSTLENFPSFADGTGKLLKDSGFNESDITSLQTIQLDHENRVIALEASSTDHETRIIDLETSTTEVQASLTDHETRIGQNEIDIDALQASVTDHETRIGQNEIDIDALQASGTVWDAHREVPSGGQEDQVLTIVGGSPEWATQTEGVLVEDWASSTDYNQNQILIGGKNKDYLVRISTGHTSSDNIANDLDNNLLKMIAPPQVSTGLLSGGVVTLNADTIDVTAGTGTFADYGNGVYPAIEIWEFPSVTGLPLASTSTVNYVYVDDSETVKITSDILLYEFDKHNILLAQIDPIFGVVFPFASYPSNGVGQLRDLSNFIGPMNKDLIVSGKAGTVNLTNTSFKIHNFGANVGTNEETKNIKTFTSSDPTAFFVFTQTGATSASATIAVDTENYDQNGTLTPLDNINRYGFHRIYLNGNGEFILMPSQSQYDNYHDALNAAGNVDTPFVLPENIKSFTQWVGYFAFQKNDADLLDNDVSICPLWGCGISGSGGAGSKLGDVVGPVSAIDSNIATFDGATGKLIKDSGVSTSLIINNDSRIGQNETDIDALEASATVWDAHREVPSGGQDNQVLISIADVPTWATQLTRIESWASATDYTQGEVLIGGADKDYWIYVLADHTSQSIPELDIVDGNLRIVAPPPISTGVLQGGEVSKSGNTFSVTAGSGVVATYDHELYPTFKLWQWGEVLSVPFPATNSNFIIYVDGVDGQVKSTIGSTPSSSFENSHIVLGQIDPVLDELKHRATYPSNPVTQLRDFTNFFGALVKGLSYSANTTANLTASAYNLFSWGGNYHSNTDQPNEVSITAQPNATLYYYNQNGPDAATPTRTVIDTGTWDNGGTVQALDVGKFCFHRIYHSYEGKIIVLRCQEQYDTYEAALKAASEAITDWVFPSEIAGNSIWMGYFAYAKDLVDFETTLTPVYSCGLLTCGRSGGGSSGGGVGDMLGPGSSSVDNLVLFADGSGKITKDSGVQLSNLVQSQSNTSVNGNFACFTNTLGNIIDDCGISPSSLQTQIDTNAANIASNDTDIANLQANKGDVTGPASSVNNSIAVYNGTTGKIIKDGGVAVSQITTNTTNINNKLNVATNGGGSANQYLVANGGGTHSWKTVSIDSRVTRRIGLTSTTLFGGSIYYASNRVKWNVPSSLGNWSVSTWQWWNGGSMGYDEAFGAGVSGKHLSQATTNANESGILHIINNSNNRWARVEYQKRSNGTILFIIEEWVF